MGVAIRVNSGVAPPNQNENGAPGFDKAAIEAAKARLESGAAGPSRAAPSSSVTEKKK
jgi:hypothetical protein